MVSSGKVYKGQAAKVTSEGRIIPQKPKMPSKQNVLHDIRQMKQDETRKKQELYLHQKLVQLKEQEAKYTVFNRHKLQVKWREILRKAKTKELIAEIDVLSHGHGREVDRKDALIQMLYRDIIEAEEQFKIALRTHQKHVDELIQLHGRRMENMEEVFQSNLKDLQTKCTEEMNSINENQNSQVQEMVEVTKEMVKRETKKNERLQKQFGVESKAIISKYKNSFEVMRIQMEKIIKEKQSEYKDSNEEYGKPISSQYRDYEDLRAENDLNEEKIRFQMGLIRKNEELLSQWKAKWLNNQREAEKRNKQLKEEINVLKGHFTEVKTQMQQFREQENTKLKTLVKQSKHTSNVLKKQLKHTERIINLNLFNQKAETIVERGMLERKREDSELNRPSIDDQQQNIPKEEQWQQLSHFYSKYNKVLLDTTALTEEKEVLLSTNNRLRAMLKAYLDGVSVSPGVMAAQNPLLIVEQINNQQQPAPMRI